MPYVTSAKVYVENGGSWVLHVWTELFSTDSEKIHTLNNSLNSLLGTTTGYTTYVVHLRDSDNA